MKKGKPREIAVRVLLQSEDGDDYLEGLLARELPALALEDRHLCQELVFGVTRNRGLLDWLIGRRTGQRPQKPPLVNLLRLGLYQLFWLDRIPDHAVVNETVELARQFGFGPQSGFVNAVLRGYARERDQTRLLIDQLKVDEPDIAYSHPRWLCERWQKRWGALALRRLLEWNNLPAPTFARVNTLKTDAGKLLTQWREEEVEYDFIHHEWLEENLVFQLKAHPPLATLPSFQQGCFYIQDPSTLLAVEWLDPQPGDRVLDVCAAPGGKMSYIAQIMRNEGQLVASDLNPKRLRLMRQNATRLGITCVQIEETDGTSSPVRASGAAETDSDRFDRVLVDAPCSNTGVMRRRVEVRWRVRPPELRRLQQAQVRLLRQATTRLWPGGILVYSTCSLEPEENSEVIKAVLDAVPEFELERERLLTPIQNGVDGAYVAVLRRGGT
ncbi:MAG: 16S rRNA (cytosine(967)-C(5))-methyltransferase RsmB [Verrucomicrobia bacterium]|nr:16S rRNA (cytosine(967)-C(5))-methyltransferase RsmB [Verrucomicrobiota bacterium]